MITISSAPFSFLSSGSVTVRPPPVVAWPTMLQVAGPASSRCGITASSASSRSGGNQIPRIQGPRNSPGPPARRGRALPATGVATLLLDVAEDLARGRGVAILGITVGIFDKYGPAQRLYAQRGYLPDGRGACRGQAPLSNGARVIMDDDLIIWLTKQLHD